MQYENEDLHAFVYSPEVLALVKSANGLCSFLESFDEGEGSLFVQEMVGWLSDIYASMLRVGETEAVYEEAVETTVSEQEWSALYQKVARLMGPHNEIIRPAEEDEFDRSELVTHTISEDLADLYQELRDFTAVYSRGLEELMNDATWELRERFLEHWGKKLLRALGALHEVYAKGIDPTEE